ncbi:hypothetical protein BOX15_Mlig024706g1 [Macrostomum lignano]|uniref:Non-lysosomal glucosylceramidase n=1 Tax=Macrostomum lignano TaxID=282301 RepID=A0A267FK21_9PLAT|nr:hypothetical protein BOX15_Mlig024706g1 [Macrostomum lignano]
MACTYGVAAMPGDNSSVTIWPRFDPSTNPSLANRLWSSLINTGRLIKWPPTAASSESEAKLFAGTATKSGEEVATAVCVSSRVPARSSVDSAKFCLAWHLPNVRFRSGEQLYTRRHTRWFNGSQSEATIALIRYSFNRLPNWLESISNWHNSVLNDSRLPDWFKSAVFNESYYLSDSGSIWLDGGDTNDWHSQDGRWRCPVKAEMGLFAYLEGHEYRMFSTYDVHTYASWAFLENFPKLQIAIQYDFAKAAVDEDQTKVHWLVTNVRTGRNQRMCLPHDLGDPEDEPFIRVNSYIMMCSDDWRDLNPKFVLSVYRDWKLLPEHNTEYLADMMPIVEGLMRRCLQWDTDNDGLVENTGYADQTYDAWPMTGVSAYCAGLWLAALRATAEMSAVASADRASANEWRLLADKARASYLDKLWTGQQFRFDTGGRFNDTVMSDQLFGYWMLKTSQQDQAATVGEQDPLLPEQFVRVTMETVYRCNCLAQGFNGQMGLFNGGRLKNPLGPELRSIQAEESWIGVSYGVASLMLESGLAEQAWSCAAGTYETVWNDFGLAYQTPEAIFSDRRFRSLGYMRPLCVWALLRSARKSSS